MRNLKKYLAVLLTVAMLATCMVPAFANTAATLSADAQACKDLGMLVGDSDAGVTAAYVATAPTRAQAAVMFLRLKGLEATAKAFKGTENFSDVSASNWFAPYAAYLKANPALGFEGVGDNKFDPEAKISAQQFYKVVLTALGFKQDVDYKWEEVKTFAASKGLSKVAGAATFTVADLATATVEGLKATVKGSADTLATTLIASGAISVEKAVYANVYVKPTAAPVAKGFEVSNKAKTLTVTFTYEPADAAKVAITVTRDSGIAVATTFKQDQKNKKVFTFTSDSALVAGDYSVAVKDDAADYGKKSVKVEAEKLAKIEVTSKMIVRYSDFKGIAYYKASNQYGEDVTTAPIAGNITWTTSLGDGAVTADKGRLTFTKGTTDTDSYMGKLRDYTMTPVVINGYDQDSGVVINTTLTVSNTLGDIQSLKLLGISNKDGKKEIEKETTDVFYIDYEAKDSAGNLVTDYNILSNTMAFMVNPGLNQSSIAWAEVVTDPSDDKKAAIKVGVPTGTTTISGTQVITAVAVGSGKSDSINVEVKEGSQLKEFILQKPQQDVAVADGYVQVPFIALDSNGKEIKEYNKIMKAWNNNKLQISGTSNAPQWTQNSDGTAGLWMDFGNNKTTVSVTATATTTSSAKMSMITVNVREKAFPTTISALPYDLYLLPTASSEKGFNDIKVLDNYDRPVDFKFGWETFTNVKLTGKTYDSDYQFAVEVKSVSDTTKLTTSGMAYAEKKIKAIAGNVYGSSTVTFALNAYDVKSGSAGFGTKTELATKSVTFVTVDPKDIVNYAIEAIPTMQVVSKVDPTATASVKTTAATSGAYFNIPFDTSDSATQPSSLDLNKNTDWNKENTQEVKVRGLLSGGQKVLVPDSAIINLSISDTSRFYVDTLRLANKRVMAVALPNSETSATAKLTATVKGYQNTISVASVDVTSSSAKPVAASLNVAYRDPGKDTAETAWLISDYTNYVGDGWANRPTKTSLYAGNAYPRKTPFTQKGDTYEISKANFDKFVVGQYLTKFNKDTGAKQVAALYFEVKDQYGKTFTEADYLQVVESTGSKYEIVGSKLVLKSGQVSAQNDTIKVNATKDGLTKTIIISVK